jgi:shikimate dehydrogenase
MHRAAYAALGLNADYEIFDVRSEQLATAMQRYRARGLRQLAVSIPHKEAMLALVDEVEPVARAIGAINTVTRRGERMIGSNTDWVGALRAIERETTLTGKRAVVLGAGGTARALVYGLRERGAEVHVLNRTPERAEALSRELGAASAGSLDALTDLKPQILVNTTSVGMNEDRSPVPASALGEGMVVLDAVYAPALTRLLADARDRGGRPIGGKWMLVYQAVEQLRQWTASLEPAPSSSELTDVIATMAKAFDDAAL